MADNQSIMQLLESDDPDQIREGAYEAGGLGLEDAVPALVRHIHSRNLGVQEAADRALRQIGGSSVVQAIMPLLRDDDAPVRNISMDILREVGRHDFQSLISLLRDADPDIRIFVSDILGSTGNVLAVQPLCEALLRDPEVNVRYQAAVSLGNLAFAEAAACLNKAMADEEWVQFAVIEALTKIRDESSVNALAKALESSSDLVASMIVEALGEMGNIKAVAVLLKHMERSPTPLRNIIVKAIVRIMGSKSLTLLSAKDREKFHAYMLAALNDEDDDIQDAAIQGLAHVGGDDATTAILRIAAGMDPERDAERQDAAIKSLASIGLNAAMEYAVRNHVTRGMQYLMALTAVHTLARVRTAECAALLMDVFWHKERDMQRELVTALLQVADESAKDFFLNILDRHQDGTIIKGALNYLGGISCSEEDGGKLFLLLEHPFDDVKEAALEACITIGGDAMVGRFKDMLTSIDPVQRMMAVYAIGKLGVREHLEELTQALEDEIPDIRKVALEALADIVDGEGLELILPRLNDENRDVRLTVVELLGQCDSPTVVPHLLQMLDDDDDWVRVRGIEALGTRGAHEAIEKLVGFLSGASKLVALKAVEALGRIGGQAAFHALLDIAGTEDDELQAAAVDALANIQEEQGVEG
ncbi:MAG: HEAT repeat domain-containing protein [Desulfovibrionaceae bacterium]